ncbi:TerD family protein [Nocardia sp. NPDC049149]|uniref:TerD family protein n=1 Tax=Nocardia sp. NPDC049149 TaxID=3364315 RepID=UPI00371035AE
MKLSKGANAAVPTSLLAVVVSWRSAHAVDAHALLLGQDGTVRTDRDLVFYNAPRHVSQAVTLDQQPAPQTARLSVSLPRTEADVARIVISGSVDEATFGDITGLTLTIHDANGPMAGFDIENADAVTALMFGEFYRRDGQWRFRAIGQGWDTGLTGLVTEFGVSVDDPAERARTAHPADPFGGVRRTPQASGLARGPVLGDPSRERGPANMPDQGDPNMQGSSTEAPNLGDPNRERDSTGALDLDDLNLRAADRVSAGSRTDLLDEPPVPEGRWHRTVDLARRREPAPAPAPPPNPQLADWHLDPENPARLRWWDGTEWTTATQQHLPPSDRHCARCGNLRRRKLFGGLAPCQSCAGEIEEFLTHWHTQAWRVLTTYGPRGPEWAGLWASLRYQRIEESAGRDALRDVGLSYAERLVTFTFADGEVEQDELAAFEHAVAELALAGPLIEDLRRRMHRGRTLSRLRAGELPVMRTPGLHLDPEEKVHLDLPAVHVRQLARGPRLTDGRLIVSNKKLRFVGDGTGTELPWNRVVSVHAEQDAVVLAATSARGGATFTVTDPDYVAAALEGALRVAKRLILTPGQRDTRSIPQEVKAEVWQRDGGKCVECGDSHYLEFDHIIPLSRGGATSATNLQILCRACNRAKGARI